MEVSLTSYEWLKIPHEIRQELVRIFAIPQTGVRRVEYSARPTVISDGHTYDDLQIVTKEKMQAFLNTTEVDFHVLFNMVLDRINFDKATQEAEELISSEDILRKKEEAERVHAVEALARVGEMAEAVLKPRRGRPPKVRPGAPEPKERKQQINEVVPEVFEEVKEVI